MSGIDKPVRPQDLLDRDEKTRQIRIERLRNELSTLDQQLSDNSEKQERIEAGPENEHRAEELEGLKREAFRLWIGRFKKMKELIEYGKDFLHSSSEIGKPKH
ncbi:MAG: hypothetical protein Q7S08_01165 [bacterium]|nr:hypothetical protein [bacterium]